MQYLLITIFLLIAIPYGYCDTDWNRDNRVTQADIAEYVQDWYRCVSTDLYEPQVDFYGDLKIDAVDIAVFINTWMIDREFCQ